MKGLSASVNGLLLVDKEPGITSQGVVAKCRRAAGQKKVGHSGTLDPDATGLLLVAFGTATRLITFTSGFEKAYSCEMVLGATTSTLDDQGSLTGTFDMSGVATQEVVDVAAKFIGNIMQTPPMVSAIKVNGQRLHQLAREGIEVERKARPVVVHSLDITPTAEAHVYRIDTVVSTGTYVRSLVDDIGKALGGGAHLRNLRRSRIGHFTTDNAVAQASLDGNNNEWQQKLLTPKQMISHLPALHLEMHNAQKVRYGSKLGVDEISNDEIADPQIAAGNFEGEISPVVAMCDSDGELLGVYEQRGRFFCSVVNLPPGYN